jgi:hypothetical protein
MGMPAPFLLGCCPVTASSTGVTARRRPVGARVPRRTPLAPRSGRRQPGLLPVARLGLTGRVLAAVRTPAVLGVVTPCRPACVARRAQGAGLVPQGSTPQPSKFAGDNAPSQGPLSVRLPGGPATLPVSMTPVDGDAGFELGGAASTPTQPGRRLGHLGSPLFDNGGTWFVEPMGPAAVPTADLLTGVVGPELSPQPPEAAILDWASMAQTGAADEPTPAVLAGLLPAGLLDSPPGSPPAGQVNVAPEASLGAVSAQALPSVPDAEQGAVAAFLHLNICSPDQPLLQHPPPSAAQEAAPAVQDAPRVVQMGPAARVLAQRRSSPRLADKPTAKLHSIARCQTVLMKKLDLLPTDQSPKEDHKQRLVGLFRDGMPPQAFAAVEELLSDVNPVGNAVDA